MSGVEVGKGIAEAYNDIKFRRKFKWIILKIQDKKTIVVDSLRTSGDFKGFKEELMASNEPRYALYDFNLITTEGREINKIGFIFWYVLFYLFIP